MFVVHSLIVLCLCVGGCFLVFFVFFFFKQKTAYEMRISDWSSDVCSSDLGRAAGDGVPRRKCCGGVQKHRDILGAERLAAMENAGALDEISEFADIEIGRAHV